MSDENENSNLDPEATKATDTNKQTPNELEAIKKQLADLEANNKRLADENNSYKTKEEQEKIKREEAERERLKNGSPEERLEAERQEKERIKQENEKYSKELKALRNRSLDQAIRSKLAQLFPDLHPNAMDDLLNTPSHKKILLDGIDQESLTADEGALKEFGTKALELKPYLRKPPTQAGVDAQKPNARDTSSGKAHEDKSLDELKEELRNSVLKKK